MSNWLYADAGWSEPRFAAGRVQISASSLLYLESRSLWVMLTATAKAEIIKKFEHQAGDVGSSEVQVALLTARIRDLQDHFTANKKDVHSRMGLLRMVAKRRKLLKYLKATNPTSHRQLIEQLEIRG